MNMECLTDITVSYYSGILVTVTVADHDDCTSTDCKARCYSKHYMTGYCVNRGISIDIC